LRIRGLTALKLLLRAALAGLVVLLLAVAAAPRAGAQEIEPYEFQPLPAGTNLAIGYYIYGHDTEFNIARGPTVKDSGLEANYGVFRYVHFFNPVGGLPVGFQIYQIFGSLSAGHIDSERLGSAFGAQTTTLSFFFWPYVNRATQTNVNITGFLYPPDGSYDPHSAINVGDNRVRGDVQVGLTQGFGEHLGVDLSFDAMFYGANNSYPPGYLRLTQDPTYRGQVWANWRWTRAFSTSIGYEGLFGGTQYVNGFLNGSKTEEQRLRANAALFLTPRLQTMIELNHDLHVVGGFKQDFGATLRVLFVF